MTDRDPADVGVIVATPGTVGGKPRLAGSRITTACLYGWHTAGESVERIIEAYPHLDRADVLAAVAFEQGRRWKRGGASMPEQPDYLTDRDPADEKGGAVTDSSVQGNTCYLAPGTADPNKSTQRASRVSSQATTARLPLTAAELATIRDGWEHEVRLSGGAFGVTAMVGGLLATIDAQAERVRALEAHVRALEEAGEALAFAVEDEWGGGDMVEAWRALTATGEGRDDAG